MFVSICHRINGDNHLRPFVFSINHNHTHKTVQIDIDSSKIVNFILQL